MRARARRPDTQQGRRVLQPPGLQRAVRGGPQLAATPNARGRIWCRAATSSSTAMSTARSPVVLFLHSLESGGVDARRPNRSYARAGVVSGSWQLGKQINRRSVRRWIDVYHTFARLDPFAIDRLPDLHKTFPLVLAFSYVCLNACT